MRFDEDGGWIGMRARGTSRCSATSDATSAEVRVDATSVVLATDDGRRPARTGVLRLPPLAGAVVR